jgi:hypothetical protein
MSLDGGGRITSWDGSAGEWACEQLPGWDEVSPLSPGVGTSPELFLGLEGGRTALRKPAGHAADRNKCTRQPGVCETLHACLERLRYKAALGSDELQELDREARPSERASAYPSSRSMVVPG